MNKRDFVKRVSEVLRDSDIKKPISIPKQVFHISDDEGNSKDFTVKKVDKYAIYTANDISAIMDACLYVIQESLKKGEPISLHGFGTFSLRYRKPRATKSIKENEDIVIEGRYVPKFSFGNELRLCAKMYELSLSDRLPEPEPVFDEADEEGGG